MKVLKPEIDAIKERLGDNKMKIQQETMKLQNIAGASPLKGCLPAHICKFLYSMPLFTFFPTAFDLRQKSFLWADDLSSYDTVYQFPAGFLYSVLWRSCKFISHPSLTGYILVHDHDHGAKHASSAAAWDAKHEDTHVPVSAVYVGVLQ